MNPTILISACESDRLVTNDIYNGGVKLHNMLVKLLRQKGYDAYVVTWDGTYHDWLIEHQPHISIATARDLKNKGCPLKFVTTWAIADAFIELADKLYLFDCEPAYTFGQQFPTLLKLKETKDLHVAVETRAEQAYYRTMLQMDAMIVPPYCDPDYWYPGNQAICRFENVGYMDEGEAAGDSSTPEIEAIRKICRDVYYMPIDFEKIAGNECEVIHNLQCSDIYLGLNRGKDKWHEEGLARSHLEAMACGCVVVAYDIGGNREFLLDGYNGMLVPRGSMEGVVQAIWHLVSNPKLKEEMRCRSVDIALRAFTRERHWRALREFLELE